MPTLCRKNKAKKKGKKEELLERVNQQKKSMNNETKSTNKNSYIQQTMANNKNNII